MQLTENDFDKLQLSECNPALVQALLDVTSNDTLGRKVSIALNQKQQGHFNKAMLNISEANRDQIRAIRKIQSILDQLSGKGKTTVIFEKLHQEVPFQIGLTDGEGVLELLHQVRAMFDDGLVDKVPALHENEGAVALAKEELAFLEERMAGKVTEEELNAIRDRIPVLSNHINSTKKKILENLTAFIVTRFRSASPNDRLQMLTCLYILITSSIRTVDAQSR